MPVSKAAAALLCHSVYSGGSMRSSDSHLVYYVLHIGSLQSNFNKQRKPKILVTLNKQHTMFIMKQTFLLIGAPLIDFKNKKPYVLT